MDVFKGAGMMVVLRYGAMVVVLVEVNCAGGAEVGSLDEARGGVG